MVGCMNKSKNLEKNKINNNATDFIIGGVVIYERNIVFKQC